MDFCPSGLHFRIYCAMDFDFLASHASQVRTFTRRGRSISPKIPPFSESIHFAILSFMLRRILSPLFFSWLISPSNFAYESTIFLFYSFIFLSVILNRCQKLERGLPPVALPQTPKRQMVTNIWDHLPTRSRWGWSTVIIVNRNYAFTQSLH